MTHEFDPDHPDVMADPHAIYHRLRAEDPVHWNAALNGWMLTRYDDVRMAQRDPRFSAERAIPFADQMDSRNRPKVADMGRLLAKWVVFNDPPRHTVLRRLMLEAFTPRAIDGLVPEITTIVDGLLAKLAGRDEIDLIGDFAYPLPATVIAHILGVPGKDIDRFRDWSDALALVVGSVRSAPDRFERGAEALVELTDYFRDAVTERRARGAKGALIDSLIEAHDADGSLSIEELVGNCVILLFAGHETTTNLIGNGILVLLDNPDQLAALRADPSLIEPAVEEILRYEPSVHSILRLAAEDMTLRGKRIRAGDRIQLMLGAANRDPEVFDDPDRFRIDRAPNRHLGFGYGLHFCVGAELARVEGRIALAHILKTMPHLALTGETLDREMSLVLRGVNKLPLSVRHAA